MQGFFKSTLLALFFSFLAVPSVFAQGLPGIGTPFNLSLNPANPKPGDEVSLSITSNSISIDGSYVTWYVDGKIISEGNGQKTAKVVAGPLGSVKNIEVTVDSRENGQFSEQTSIRPANLDLLWQAATYVPFFYKGKALESHGANYKVVAIPEITDASGKRINPNTLVYAWKKNDANLPEQSGYGKKFMVSNQSSFVRAGDEISVTVTSPEDGFSVSARTTVTARTPEINLYENSPLYGNLYNFNVSDRFFMTNEEITLAAEPFYFSTMSPQSKLLGYTWTIDNAEATEFTNKPYIILRKVGEASGNANIGLVVKNSAKLLQGGSKSVNIFYE